MEQEYEEEEEEEEEGLLSLLLFWFTCSAAPSGCGKIVNRPPV